MRTLRARTARPLQGVLGAVSAQLLILPRKTHRLGQLDPAFPHRAGFNHLLPPRPAGLGLPQASDPQKGHGPHPALNGQSSRQRVLVLPQRQKASLDGVLHER